MYTHCDRVDRSFAEYLNQNWPETLGRASNSLQRPSLSDQTKRHPPHWSLQSLSPEQPASSAWSPASLAQRIGEPSIWSIAETWEDPSSFCAKRKTIKCKRVKVKGPNDP